MSAGIIVGIGTVVVDDVVELDRFPEPDSKAPIRARWRQVGGPVPTALVAAARLGSSCAFAGKWADDPEGAFVAADLEREGIDTRLCERASASGSAQGEACHTGFAQVWVDRERGGRNIAFSRGQFPPLAPFELPAGTRLLHLDGAHGDAAVAAAETARERGLMVVLDAGTLKSRMEDLFPLADVVVGSTQFLRSVTGSTEPAAAAAAMVARGVRRMVMTHGAAGAWICLGGPAVLVHVPAFEVEAVDTTGAGDVFCGGLIHALANLQDPNEDLDAALPEAVRFASATAAWKCKARGNRAALPSLAELETFT